jgi:hypothetical protein
MRAERGFGLAAAVIALVVGTAEPAKAASITIDENGNGVGTVGGGFLASDPGPGGLSSVLTYNLPFSTVVGDFILLEPGTGGATTSDVVRFNGTTLLIYSDSIDGVDSIADGAPPGAEYTNRLTLTEVGPEGINGFTYTPTAGQPGFVTGGVTYVIVSDGTFVPEPSSWITLGIGLGVTTLIGWSRHRRAQRRRATA